MVACPLRLQMGGPFKSNNKLSNILLKRCWVLSKVSKAQITLPYWNSTLKIFNIRVIIDLTDLLTFHSTS